MSKNHISFILHKPQLSENIGACARAVKNFNFKKLVLINPKPIQPNDQIYATSEDAKNILTEHEKKISNSKTEVKRMISKASEEAEKNVIKTNQDFHNLMETRKKNAEDRIKQQKNQL